MSPRLLLAGVLAAGLMACAARGTPRAARTAPNDAWLVITPSTPALCLPWLGSPDEATGDRWSQVVAHLQARDLAAAADALGPATDDEAPALQALRGAVTMLQGAPDDAAARLDSLLRRHGKSACLLAATAAAQDQVGDRDEAATRVALAQRLAPDDPEIALMYAYMAPVEQAGKVLPALEAGATVSPDRLAYAIALGVAAITLGDADGAVRWLEQAFEGGDAQVAPMLLLAYRGAGATDDYLRLAARMGLPVPGDLAHVDAPLDHLLGTMGVTRGQAVPAVLHTSLGDAHCELFPEVAPVTVASFVGLATGTQPWITPEGDLGQGPLYRSLTFHRVVPDFMVQTGDPEGTGEGGPGYRFPDEVDPDLLFDAPGRLAMANSGPNSNGSQFFVTEAPARHLDGRHTIFGQCDAEAVALVGRIARADGPVVLQRVALPSVPEPAPPTSPEPADESAGPFATPPEDDKL